MKIGNVTIENNLILAPMAGVTDLPFRLLCMEQGAGMACMENPSGPTAVWCSIIPFTSPVVMMIRLPFGVPIWQLLLSLGLLFGTALGITWSAARIYRRGILHYGKKASFADLFKWMK